MDVWNVYEFSCHESLCHHSDSMVCVTNETGEAGSHIVHIVKPSRQDVVTIGVKEGDGFGCKFVR